APVEAAGRQPGHPELLLHDTHHVAEHGDAADEAAGVAHLARLLVVVDAALRARRQIDRAHGQRWQPRPHRKRLHLTPPASGVLPSLASCARHTGPRATMLPRRTGTVKLERVGAGDPATPWRAPPATGGPTAPTRPPPARHARPPCARRAPGRRGRSR